MKLKISDFLEKTPNYIHGKIDRGLHNIIIGTFLKEYKSENSLLVKKMSRKIIESVYGEETKKDDINSVVEERFLLQTIVQLKSEYTTYLYSNHLEISEEVIGYVNFVKEGDDFIIEYEVINNNHVS
jgi:hypothetical protein